MLSRTTGVLVLALVLQLAVGPTAPVPQVAVATEGEAGRTAGPGATGHARIAAGSSHSLYLADDGYVYAWGSNTRGQLGDGTTTSSNLPVRVTADGALDGVRLVEVAAGPMHSLALADDGTVYAWGDGSSGQLGTGAVEGSPVPVRVGGDLEGRHVVQVSAGGSDAASTSLAVTDDGALLAWGRNLDGRLGLDVDDEVVPWPTMVGGALDGLQVVRASAGMVNGVALTADGLAYAWGARVNGGVGAGSTAGIQRVPAPVSTAGVLSGARLVDLDGGWGRTVAVDDRGLVYGWGDGSHGGHGNGSTSHATTPVLADMEALAAVGVRPVAVAAGQFFSVLLGEDGTVATWGAGTSGQLGNGASATSATAVAVSTDGVLAGVEVVEVAAGLRHALALGSDGQVYAWGQGSSGELGHGVSRGSNVPVRVGAPVPVTVAALGGASSEATPLVGGAGSVWATVTVAVDDVPVGTTTVGADGRWLFRVPQVLALGERTVTATQSSDGSSAAVAVDVVGHALTAWGSGVDEEMLGVTSELLDRRVVQVATAAEVAVVLTDAGAVLAGGTDAHGRTDVPPGLEGDVVQVAAGETFALALTGDGAVHSWGDDGLAVPEGLGGRRVVQVATGARTAYALLSDGTVVAWGDDSAGQASVPVDVSSVVHVAAGGRFAAAVTATGGVHAWGDDAAGQVDVPREVQGEVVVVEAGDDFGLALLRGGVVAAWGQGEQGQTAVPDEVQGTAVGLGAGADVAMAVTAEGGLVVWGSDEHGMLDLPEPVSRQHVVQASGGRAGGLAVVDLVTITEPADDALVWVMDSLPVAGRAAPGSVLSLTWSVDGAGAAEAEVEVGPDGRWSTVVEGPLVAGRLTLVATSSTGAVDETTAVVAHAPGAVLQVVPRAVHVGSLARTGATAQG